MDRPKDREFGVVGEEAATAPPPSSLPPLPRVAPETGVEVPPEVAEERAGTFGKPADDADSDA